MTRSRSSWRAHGWRGQLLVLLGVLAAAPSFGCATARYLWRAAEGHLGVMLAAIPIEDVLDDPRTPPPLHRVLEELGPVRAYAAEVGLAIGDNYRAYVPLGRPEVVWNLNASTPLGFEQHHWTFPLIGSVPYLGFYDAFEAMRYAKDLGERQGLDVYVRPVSAYSTLGWFDDPLLSSMVEPGPASIGLTVNRVLHETTHSTIYVPGQSTFNENIATFVGDGLTSAYLTQRFGPGSKELAAYDEKQGKWAKELEILLAGFHELQALYTSEASDADKLARKREVFVRLERDIDAPRPLNNATLVYLQTYRSGSDELAHLHEACGGDWSRTIRALAGARATDFDQDQQDELEPVIERISERGC